MTNQQQNCHGCGHPFNNDCKFPCQLPCYHFICLQCRDAQLSSTTSGCDPQSHEHNLNCPTCKTEHKINIYQ